MKEEEEESSEEEEEEEELTPEEQGEHLVTLSHATPCSLLYFP